MRFLRIKEVVRITGIPRTTIYKRMKDHPGAFPAPVQLGTASAVGWLEEEVLAWMRAQVRNARPEPMPSAPEQKAG